MPRDTPNSPAEGDHQERSRDEVLEPVTGSSAGSHAFFYTDNSDSCTKKCPDTGFIVSDGPLVDNRVYKVRVCSGQIIHMSRCQILDELERLPDSALIDTEKAGIYLDVTPKSVRMLYQDKLLDGVQARGPKGRIRIRLGSLRRMSGQARKVRK